MSETLDSILKEQVEKQIKASGMLHLVTRQQELLQLLVDIQEDDLSTIEQVKGLIHNTLERVELSIKDYDNE